jgi:hypothetical protein
VPCLAPPDTWRGDKSLREVWQFGKKMRALGAPRWGYLTNNRTPTLEDMR